MIFQNEKEDLYSPNRPQDQIVKYLANEGAVDINGLRRKFGYQAKDLIDDLMRDGCVTRHWSWPRPRISHKYIGILALDVPVNVARTYSRSLSSLRSSNQIKLLNYLEDNQSLIITNANKSYGYSAVATLIKKGLVKVKRIKQERDPLSGLAFPEDEPLTLTDTQNHAVDSIRNLAEVDVLRGTDTPFRLLWIDAPLGLRLERIRARSRPGDPDTIEALKELDVIFKRRPVPIHRVTRARILRLLGRLEEARGELEKVWVEGYSRARREQ